MAAAKQASALMDGRILKVVALLRTRGTHPCALASLFRNDPEEITAMANHMMAGQAVAAREIASTIGLTEEAFQEKAEACGGFSSFLPESQFKVMPLRMSCRKSVACNTDRFRHRA